MPERSREGKIFYIIPFTAQFAESIRHYLVSITLNSQTRFMKCFRFDFDRQVILIEMRGDFKWEI